MWPALALAAGGTILGGRALVATRGAEPSADQCRAPVATVVGLAAIAGQTAFASWLAVRSPLSAWDAWSVWAFKARMFALGGPRPGYFHDPATLHTHPDYPLNLPLAETALLRLPNPLGLSLAALLGPACLAALLLLLFAGLTRLHGRTIATAATCALALVPALPLQASGGDADALLTLYAGAATLYLLLWWRLHRPGDAVLSGLLAGGAIWTKKEGLAVAALLWLAFAIAELVRRDGGVRERAWRVARGTLAVIALPLPWLLFTRLAHPLGRDFLPLTPAVFVAHADRLPHIALTFALQMLALNNWSLLWVLLACGLLLAGRRLPPHGRGLLALLAAQLGVYMIAFVFSDWQPYTAHVQTSLNRLLLQVVPLALLVLVECVHAMATPRARSAAAAASCDVAAA